MKVKHRNGLASMLYVLSVVVNTPASHAILTQVLEVYCHWKIDYQSLFIWWDTYTYAWYNISANLNIEEGVDHCMSKKVVDWWKTRSMQVMFMDDMKTCGWYGKTQHNQKSVLHVALLVLKNCLQRSCMDTIMLYTTGSNLALLFIVRTTL